jgi:hypothetical protein
VNNGVILEHNPTIINRRLVMDRNSLIERLKEGDENVIFVPFGFKTGEQKPKELEKNPYVIARYGKEGASKIAEVSDEYKNHPCLGVLNSVDEELLRMSALGRDFVGRLVVDGDSWNTVDIGCSFGVLGSEKKAA